jgi:hypothetical protein
MKYEAGTFVMCAVPALLYMTSKGIEAGVGLFLLCFLIAQPFLLYAFKDGLFRREKQSEESK